MNSQFSWRMAAVVTKLCTYHFSVLRIDAQSRFSLSLSSDLVAPCLSNAPASDYSSSGFVTGRGTTVRSTTIGMKDVRYTRRRRVGCRLGDDCIAVACYVQQWITWTQRSEQKSNYNRRAKSRASERSGSLVLLSTSKSLRRGMSRHHSSQTYTWTHVKHAI